VITHREWRILRPSHRVEQQVREWMSPTSNEDLERWLNQEVPEDVLEPDLPIVDPHHHLWDIRSFTIPPHVSFEQ
jgi:hypothetical protein